MNLLQIIILSIVEGITEFLPVSSTGHLIFTQKLLGLTQVDEFITVVLQLGAILAAVFYFRNRIFTIYKNTFLSLKNNKIQHDLGAWILVSIIPTLAMGYVLKDYIAEFHNSTLLVVVSTIIFGVIFYVIERLYIPKTNKIDLETVRFRNVFTMGIYQIFSLLPGVSRSGITVSGGLTQNLTFKDSIEISFIMSIPVMLVASGYEVVKNISTVDTSKLGILVVGLIVTFITSFLGIKLTLGLLTKHGFLPFMIYRIVFGVVFLLLLR